MPLAPLPPPVLVLAPHPDDETFGCGGTLRLLADHGVPIDATFMTRGELGGESPGQTTTAAARQRLATVRTEEAGRACELLGVRRMQFLDGEDTRVAQQPHLADAIAELLARSDYARVFCPWPGDAHPDHQATCAWLRRAMAQSGATAEVWLYEVWTPLSPNMLAPIDGTIEAKRRAMGAYRSQLSDRDYLAAFSGLAAYRGLLAPPARFAEAFWIMSGAEFISCDRSDR